MKKIKITKEQKLMLESTANAKLKLAEGDIPFSQSPSAKVTGEFKKAKIKGFKAESAESPVTNDINWSELVTNVHEFLKQMYTNPSKEGLNPYWETIDVTWDELIQMLTAVGIIKGVKGGYRLTKVVESPSKAVKIVAKLIEKMVMDKNVVPVEEIMSADDTKSSLSNQVAPAPKTGKTRAELLAVIAQKRKEEMDRRELEKKTPPMDDEIKEDNYPAGASNDPNAPWNKTEPEPKINVNNPTLDLIWFDDEYAIFKKDGKLFLYYVDSADKSEYADYASREETFLGRDEDGMPDVEYGDFDIDGDIVSAYVNNNIQHLSSGKGLDDYENGIELVEIDYPLAKDLLELVPYIAKRDIKAAQEFQTILSSIPVEETTSTGSVGGSYVGKMSMDSPIAKSNVASGIKTTIEEVDSTQPIKSDIITAINPFITHSIDSSILFWLKNESQLKEIVDKIQSLRDDEWDLMIQFIVKGLQSAETYIDKKERGAISAFQNSISGLNNFVKYFMGHLGESTTTVSAGGDNETFAYDAPAGDGSKFWTAGNKLNKKSVKENQNKDTQYPNGKFVKFDDCTKLNNNKVAQNGGCSTGAVDNVVKTKSTKNSVISDSSVYESVAKATGRTVEDVKVILDKKINKSN